MVDVRLVASATSYFVIAAFYVYLGSRLLRRRIGGNGGRAAGLFGVWWIGIGSHSAIAGLLTVALGFAAVPTVVVAAATYLAASIIAVMSYALMYYMLYLLTGRVGVVRVLAWIYAPLYVAIVLAVAYAGPRGVEMQGWVPIITYARPEGSALDGLASLAFILPPFLASGFYAALFWRVKEPAKRWRIALTGGALFGWLVASLFLGGDDLGAALGRALAFAAALGAHLAYTPPAWAQRRYGAVALQDEVVRPPTDPRVAAERREALAARARELV